ncbi:MAG: hypothetical protein AAFX40_16145 [Cyanobacteria bacterium J06639_1]
MNLKLNVAILSAVAAGALGFVPAALAGEGGIAGAASFILDGESVTEASVAAAIGKDTAYAGALTDSGLTADTAVGATQAFAIGTGGSIAFTGESIFFSDVTDDVDRATAQANELSVQTINISALSGELDLGGI